MPDRATSRRVDQAGLDALLAELDDELGGRGAAAVPAPGPGDRRGRRAGRAAPRRPAAGRAAPGRGAAVSRGTVVAAYDELVAEGVVERRRGSGTYVLGPDTLGLPPGREGSALVHRLVDRSRAAAVPARSSTCRCRCSATPTASPRSTLTTADLRATVPDTGYTPWGLPGAAGGAGPRT